MDLKISPFKTLSFAGLGLIARIVATAYFKESLRQRVEITTPINSWKAAYEGVHLWDSGLDPYLGGLFHEYPISLQFYKLLIAYCDINWTFAVVDTITAILLQYSVYHQILITQQQQNDSKKVDPSLAKRQSFRVFSYYLFSPITIMTCAGLSTSIFTNFLISTICFLIPMKPFRALIYVLCATLACNNIYYLSLILPIFLCIEYSHCNNKNTQGQQESTTNQYYQQPAFRSNLVSFIISLLATIVALMTVSYFLMGRSWNFVSSTYLFTLRIQDLKPNIGMFWYFFTEMFEHFSDFFTWVVQINAFIHVVPLSICLRDDPFFLLYLNLLTSTIFQPYPSLANIGIITSLLPRWSGLYPHMRRGLIVICAGLVCMTLWPVFWHLWIVMGTANSNFYFGVTLAFNLALIIFMADILNAYGSMKAKSLLEHAKTE